MYGVGVKLDDYLMLEHMQSGDYEAALLAVVNHFGLDAGLRLKDKTVYAYPVYIREVRLFHPDAIYSWREGIGFERRQAVSKGTFPDNLHWVVWPNRYYLGTIETVAKI